jgi:hypothetical protein
LNYFYEGKGHSTPRKNIISKINEKLIESGSQHAKKAQSLAGLDQKNSLESSREGIPPSYNTFNFHRMLKTKLSKISAH